MQPLRIETADFLFFFKTRPKQSEQTGSIIILRDV